MKVVVTNYRLGKNSGGFCETAYKPIIDMEKIRGVPVGSKSEAWFYLGAAWSPKIGDHREGPGGRGI